MNRREALSSFLKAGLGALTLGLASGSVDDTHSANSVDDGPVCWGAYWDRVLSPNEISRLYLDDNVPMFVSKDLSGGPVNVWLFSEGKWSLQSGRGAR